MANVLADSLSSNKDAPVKVPTPMPLSVMIVTLNEERNLPRCLASLQGLAGQIVVLDSGSTDQTVALARQAGALVEHRDWNGINEQKQAALVLCSQPWILSLDADEEVTPELAIAIRQVLTDSHAEADGYWINRRTWYLGKWIRHAWHPEWRLRLARRDLVELRGVDPHDVLHVKGTTAKLQGDLLHYSFQDLHDHLQRTIKYSRIMAESYEKSGLNLRWYHIVVSPWVAFIKRLVIKQAWRDGWRGWMIAFVSMFGTFAKYSFMMEHRLARSSNRDGRCRIPVA